MDERDLSNNPIHRRYDHGRIYVSDERHVAEPHHRANDDDHHERFNLNQYYNAIEDEQLYMDEYTSLLQRYNDFIVNSNTLFSRMEMTLRENITRSVSRQTYYYYQSDYLYRRELSRSLLSRAQSQSRAAAAGPAARVPTAPIPPSSAPPLQPRNSPVQRFGDMLPQLVSRYIATENSREQRRNNANNNANNNNNANANLFSMLYTFPIEAVGGAAASASRADGPPTNDQINIATSNTVFANILSPVNATCPISRDEFNDESEITMIRGCNHVFNRSSLREWFTNHATCPMCRGDIREYQPPSLQEPSAPHLGPAADRGNTDIPRNISIDSVDRDHVTFSYNLPTNTNTNNEDIYRNLINTVANMITNNQVNRNDDDDDIMEVD
jgi:hypothetical protein